MQQPPHTKHRPAIHLQRPRTHTPTLPKQLGRAQALSLTKRTDKPLTLKTPPWAEKEQHDA